MEIEGQKLYGRFLRRINRFLAEVELGDSSTLVHVPNPARLSELLVPGADVLILNRRVINGYDIRKTKHSMLAIRYKGILVGIDSRMPNHVFESSLRSGLLEEFSQWTIIKKDFQYRDSRIDYLLETRRARNSLAKRDKAQMLLEIKSCSLVINRVALFPDVPTLRGLRQIRTLINTAVTNDFRCCVLWVVQREDAEYLTPFVKIQPELEEALVKGVKSGLHVLAYNAKMETNSINIIGRIPVKLRGRTVH
jgi:sugar fermentation stimulation protein A